MQLHTAHCEERSVPVKLSIMSFFEATQNLCNMQDMIKLPADARTSYQELYKMLCKRKALVGTFPQGLNELDISEAIDGFFDKVTLSDKPFNDLSPDNSPAEGYVVRPHPRTEQWFVITPLLDIHSDWPNASEAYCAAWDLAEMNGHAEPRPQTFVYVGIEVPEPEGYQVTFHHPGDDRRPHEGYGPAWYFETDSCGSEDYSSELDARIAAWRDLFAKQDKESSTKNVILPVKFEGEYCADVTHASVAISVQDYHRWSELHKVGKENKVASLALYDSPNKFLNLLDDTADLSSQPDSDTESSFRPEAGRLEICIATETVKFVGYEKHGGPESIWLTEEIKLSELAGNFGLKR